MEKNGQTLSTEIKIALSTRNNIQQNSLSALRDAKNSVTESITTGATIVVGVGVSVWTLGGGTPLLLAALYTGAATGITNVVIKSAIKGKAYGWESLGQDSSGALISGAVLGWCCSRKNSWKFIK